MSTAVRYPTARDPRPLPGGLRPPVSSASEVSSSSAGDGTKPKNPTLDMMDEALARDLAPKQPSPPLSETVLVPSSQSSSPSNDVVARSKVHTAARLEQVRT